MAIEANAMACAHLWLRVERLRQERRMHPSAAAVGLRALAVDVLRHAMLRLLLPVLPQPRASRGQR